MSQTDPLLSAFDTSWDEFSGAWKKARSKASEKSIHDLRVSTRRLIATLELTRALSRNAEIADTQRRFKKILKRMGPLRDLQVQLESLSHMRQLPILKDFKARLEHREEREIEDIRKELKRGTYRRLSESVMRIRGAFEHFQKRLDKNKVRHTIERLLSTRQNEFVKCRRQFKPENEDTLHAMRIALKKLRYAVETAQPILGDEAAERAEKMHAFQQLMGDTRDLEILRTHLEKWAAKRGKKLAIVPALNRLEGKRERLVKTINRSLPDLDEILPKPKSSLKPAVEKTHAVAADRELVTA